MRTFAIAIIAIVIGCCVVSGSAEEEKKCVPGTRFMDDQQCNWCFCEADGRATCTKKACFKLEDLVGAPKKSDRAKRQVCEPNSRYKDDCNWCTCNAQGTMGACTRKRCMPKNINMREKRDAQQCEPGKYFEADDGCNECFCNPDGTVGGCTEKLCIKNFAFNHTRSVRQVANCEPGARFLDADGCNWCTCRADGKGAACTRKFCVDKKKGSRVTREVGQLCVPGSRYKQDCNTCRCSEDGMTAACTLKFCIPAGDRHRRDVEPAEQQVCVPNSHFRDAEDCNNCVCNDKGTAAACTLKYCFNPNRSKRQVEQVCVPRSEFMMDCNTCACSEDGMHALCTLKACPEHNGRNVISRTERQVKQICVPNSTFKQDCNTCKCSADGSAADCTEIGCRDTHPVIVRSTRQAEQICTPRSSFKRDCNNCICSDDGKNAACTLRFCIPNNDRVRRDVLSRTERQVKQICVPKSTFKQDCNTCWCNEDGTNAACTLIGCVNNLDMVATRKEKICTPGQITRAQDSCNTCRCNDDGTEQECTTVACPVLAAPVETVCTPNSVFKQDCNTCKCSKEGDKAFCTRRMCRNKRETAENEEKDKEVAAQPTPCTPDDIKIEGCNRCKCAKNGIVWLCTPGSACAPNGNGNGNGNH